MACREYYRCAGQPGPAYGAAGAFGEGGGAGAEPVYIQNGQNRGVSVSVSSAVITASGTPARAKSLKRYPPGP